MMEGMEKYLEIIDLPHHTSSHHPRMSMMSRAAQFSPFAALTGYDAVIGETSRLTAPRIELDEEARKELDSRFRHILSELPDNPEVRLTYFKKDSRKSGGRYIDFEGRLKKFDEYTRTILFEDGTSILLDDITAIR